MSNLIGNQITFLDYNCELQLYNVTKGLKKLVSMGICTCMQKKKHKKQYFPLKLSICFKILKFKLNAM